ncbi:MAG: glycosyltransferase family 4 protein [Bacteroidia bacterium]|nr:glycosyltransferase family 4 protein [Bacteroidia bacterium]
MKTIGLEATGALSARRGGIGTYCLELSKALLSLPAFSKEMELSFLYKLSRRKYSAYGLSFPGTESYWHGLGLPLKKFDLVHCTDAFFYKSGKSPVIITIHDLAIFKKPYYEIPGYTDSKFRKVMWERVSAMVKACDGIICVSQRTARDLDELFPNHGKRLIVTHLGLRTDLNQAPLKVRDLPHTNRTYILFAGLVSIRKNVLGLLRGFHRAGLQRSFDLVLAGDRGMGWEEIEKEIADLGLQDVVKVTGYLNDTQLTYYYRHASAVAMCTYYEGFGLPALEAMAMGIPVLIGQYGSLPEVCSENAVKCDPFEPDSIAEGLKATLNASPGKTAQGVVHAQQFTWERCARKTFDFYSSFV